MKKIFTTKQIYELSESYKTLAYRLGFRKISGTDRPYYVNLIDGKVCNITKDGKLKEMKDHASESEYGRVKLKMPDGKFHSLYVHRLVGQFIPNHSHKEEINHKNLDKSNNNINNLEWVSHIENIKHYHKNKKGRKI